MAFHYFILFHAFLNVYGNDKKFLCVFTKDPVIVDAQLQEFENAHSITLQHKSGKSGNKVSVSSLWDEKNLYLAFQVADKDLQAIQDIQDHHRLYMDDMVEFLLDPLNDKDSCWNADNVIYHINILGQKKDDRGTIDCATNPAWNGEALYAIRMSGSVNAPADVDDGYVVEISLPWTELGVRPFAGFTLGINLANGDSGVLFDWVGASPFRSPYAFGDLVLVKN